MFPLLRFLIELTTDLAIPILAFNNMIRGGYKFNYENSAEDSKNKWLSVTDTVYAWLIARRNEGLLIEDSTARAEASKLYEDYVERCNQRIENGEIDEENIADPTRFTKGLKKYGLKSVVKNSVRYFKVRLGKQPPDSSLKPFIE